MSEDTTVNTDAPAENLTPDAPVDTPTEQTPEEGLGIKAGEEVKVEPKGLDPELYDTQTNKLREDVVLEKLKSFDSEKAKLEKQVKDFRRIVSKGKAPEDIEDYKAYKPDSKYEKFWDLENNPITKEVAEELDKLSSDAGFNVEQNKIVKDFLNKAMEKAGVFDARSEEQIQVENADKMAKYNKVLGDDYASVKQSVIDYISSPIFSENERNAFIKSANVDPHITSALHKMKRLFRGQDQVPLTGSEVSGVPSQMSLAREYNAKNTTPERRIEITRLNLKTYNKPLPFIKP